MKTVRPLFELAALAGCTHHPLTVTSGASDPSDASPPSCPECDEHASCSQMGETVTCTCRPGFLGDGHTCEDLDECARGTDLCDRQHGICTNTAGGYACSCMSGWGLGSDGISCLDGFKAVQVSAGTEHNCAVKSDGSVVCWGYNYNGEALPPSGTFQQVSAGLHHTCGVRTDGTVVCWGNNQYGQSTPLSGTYRQVSLSVGHACAVKSDGRVVCWGSSPCGAATPPSGIR